MTQPSLSWYILLTVFLFGMAQVLPALLGNMFRIYVSPPKTDAHGNHLDTWNYDGKLHHRIPEWNFDLMGYKGGYEHDQFYRYEQDPDYVLNVQITSVKSFGPLGTFADGINPNISFPSLCKRVFNDTLCDEIINWTNSHVVWVSNQILNDPNLPPNARIQQSQKIIENWNNHISSLTDANGDYIPGGLRTGKFSLKT